MTELVDTPFIIVYLFLLKVTGAIALALVTHMIALALSFSIINTVARACQKIRGI